MNSEKIKKHKRKWSLKMYTAYKTKDLIKHEKVLQHCTIHKQPCNLGGYKYYIECSNCHRKCLKMFINNEYKLVCRYCIGLRKKQLNRTKTNPRHYYKMMIKECVKIDKHYQDKYFHDFWWLYPFPPKPPLMKFDKYIKAFNRWLKYKELAFSMCDRTR